MDYIKSFDTEQERTAAGLQAPSVSYVEENGVVQYLSNRRFSADFSDDYDNIDPAE